MFPADPASSAPPPTPTRPDRHGLRNPFKGMGRNGQALETPSPAVCISSPQAGARPFCQLLEVAPGTEAVFLPTNGTGGREGWT